MKRCITAWIVAAAFVGAAGSASAADPSDTYGAPLIPGAKRVEKSRYQVSRSFDDAVEFYTKFFRGKYHVRSRTIINQPGIKATHFENRLKNSKWEGMNIYEHRGATRIYFLSRGG